jgi:MFS family permease
MAQGMAAAPRRVGWYYGWNIVGLAVLAQMASMGLPLNCFSLFLPAWSHEFGSPVSFLQLSFSIFAIFCAFFGPVAGAAADKFPARWVLSAGLAMIVVFMVAMGFARAGWNVVVLYALVSFGVTISSTIPAQALVSRWFVQRRGLALGLSAFGLALAGVIFPPIVVVLVKGLGWRETWWLFAAVVGFVAIPTIVLFARDRPGPGDSRAYIGAHEEADAAAPSLSFKQILTRPNFWVIFCAFACVFATYQSVVNNLTPIMASHGLSLGVAGAMISAVSIADLISKVGIGALADRIGNRIPFVALGLVGAAGVGVAALAPGVPLLVVGLLLLGMAGAVWTLIASATAAEFGQRNFGRAFGLMCIASPVGAQAPPIFAWTQERTGSYTAGLLGLAVLALVGAGLAALLKENPTPACPD